MRTLVISLLLLSLSAGIAYAAEGFVPIAPISGSEGSITSASTLQQYINLVFNIALGAGAVLAVIYIAVGGYEYMLSQTLPGQKDGRARILHAFYGLAILLLIYLILYIIRPDMVSLNIF